jgi:hypothetical protein
MWGTVGPYNTVHIMWGTVGPYNTVRIMWGTVGPYNTVHINDRKCILLATVWDLRFSQWFKRSLYQCSNDHCTSVQMITVPLFKLSSPRRMYHPKHMVLHPSRLATVSQTVFNPKWIANMLQAGWSRIKSRWGVRFSAPTRLALGPTQTPVQWLLVLFPGVRRPVHGDNVSPHLASRLKNKYSYTSTAPLFLHGRI